MKEYLKHRLIYDFHNMYQNNTIENKELNKLLDLFVIRFIYTAIVNFIAKHVLNIKSGWFIILKNNDKYNLCGCNTSNDVMICFTGERLLPFFKTNRAGE